MGGTRIAGIIGERDFVHAPDAEIEVAQGLQRVDALAVQVVRDERPDDADLAGIRRAFLDGQVEGMVKIGIDGRHRQGLNAPRAEFAPLDGVIKIVGDDQIVQRGRRALDRA